MKTLILAITMLTTFSTTAYSKTTPAAGSKPTTCRSSLIKYGRDMENPTLYKSSRMLEQYLNLKDQCVIKDQDDLGFACRELFSNYRDNLKLYASLVNSLGKDSYEMGELKDSNDLTLESLLDGCIHSQKRL